MAPPVWVLSVDLQTKTATFTTGLADAARAARGSFKDIGGAATEGGERVQRSVGNVRSAIGLLDNTIRGNHAAAMADLVREFSDSSLVMAALPFAAVIGGVAAIGMIAVEAGSKIKEWREANEKLREEQVRFGTSVQETFNSLDEKIISAEQKTDELRNDHIGALGKALELINRQSFSELIHNLETFSKAADIVFGDLKDHWYSWGIGAEGAKHALDSFQAQYNSLITQGKDQAGSDLLAGTLQSARAILAAQLQAKANSGLITNNPVDSQRVQNAFQEAYVKLKAAGVKYTDDEITAQKKLIDTLEAQQTSLQKVAKLKGLETGIAKRSTAGDISREQAAAAKEAADSALRLGELSLTADKSTADARLQMQHASIQDRLTADVEFSNRETALQLAGNRAQISALDKLSKDYPISLKALQDKTLEIQQAHDTKVAQMAATAQTQQAALDLRNMQESERERITATQQGSAERLAVIDAAIQEEQAHNLQAEDSYRALTTQRVETVRQMAQQEAQAKLQAIEAASRIDEQSVQSQYRIAQEQLAARGATIAEQAALALDEENRLFQIQQSGLENELQALRQSGLAKIAEVEHIQQQIQLLTQSHGNRVAEIEGQATAKQTQEFRQAMVFMENSAAHSLLSMLSGQRGFTAEMSGLVQSLTQNLASAAIQRMNHQNAEKLGNAKTAASNTYAEVSGWPVVGPILAPVAAAGAFSAVMAFNKGTDRVPGVGVGDIVPTMLTPGEGVVPGGVMDGLRNLARNGGFENSARSVTHIHVRPVYHVQTIDGDGMNAALEKHSEQLQRHFENTLRKMNR